MNLSSIASVVSRLDYVETTGSTNSDVAAAASESAAEWPDLSVLCASSQTAGRGRSGRQWTSKANASLAASILVRPAGVPLTHFGWLPILAGLAMSQTVAEFLPHQDVSLKWPNDVLVNDKKVSGVLSELLPSSDAVVIGAGLNLSQEQDELPIEAATSLMLEGVTVSFEQALESYLKNFVALYKPFVANLGDADASGLRQQTTAMCGTIGRRVRALMPGDQVVEGNAIDLDASGRILIAVDGQDQFYAVAAGDIVHLRHN